MSSRHFWRPAADGVRHAFRGPRWNGQPEGTSMCGARTALTADVSEEDWVRAPSCADCNAVLHAARDAGV